MDRWFWAIIAAFLVFFLASCNVYQPPSMSAGLVEDYRDYPAPRREVWNALITTLAEKENIRATDAENGIVRTNYDLLADTENSRQLQYSYLITVDERAARMTRARVAVRFLLPGQPAWMEDLQAQPVINREVENYLRQDLFERICARLPACQQAPVYVDVSSKAPVPEVVEKPSETVREAQGILSTNGYFPDPASGLLADKTRQALKQFQKEYGLPITGVPDQKTMDALRSLRRH
ncbi:MAG: peptidoglycan-binding protein [Desulfobulbaceae bacterium]|jgi:murein L,D-transpeptidase YcbB/YkuD|nr:peptidoglycan-binding protein [Desulfobulbaceae bacterium]